MIYLSKKPNIIEKLIFFGVFLVFAGLIVAYSLYQTPRKVKDADDITSFQYNTSSKSQVLDSEPESEELVGLININTATADELIALPGIGPKKAETIVKYREENGYFKDANDLLDVSGIGEATLEKIKHLLSFEVNE